MDTVVDAAQGGNISPASIGTSLAINAITEGVSSKTVKGQKGEVSSHKDALLTQQIPNLSKNTPKTDFYVAPDSIVRSPQHQTIQNIIEDLPDISINTYGFKNYQSKGGYEQVLKDFDNINLTDIKEFTIPGNKGMGKVGYMEDGTKVVARSWSLNASSNSPTLEIQYEDSSIPDRGIKIRYWE
ncbi:hypothetical protein [Streptococcus ruminantium]|uniref:hypothetical protein n=2 Tax=Streptococcus ruminantium TaxID=1917441 RepID=UPI0012DF6165|nr:hypothetical protein [Streptococcus ruminantium]